MKREITKHKIDLSKIDWSKYYQFVYRENGMSHFPFFYIINESVPIFGILIERNVNIIAFVRDIDCILVPTRKNIQKKRI